MFTNLFRARFLPVLLLPILLIAAARCACAYSLCNPASSPATKALFAYLADRYGKNCFVGEAAGGIHAAGQFGGSYPTTGKYEAIVDFELSNWYGGADWQAPQHNREVITTADVAKIVEAYKNTKPILTFNWHWTFEGIGALTSAGKVNDANVLKPGTQENTDFYADMAKVADDLQVLKDANIPVLFRPFHEIDGGWFWWTDTKNPANTVALWRLMYDYMTKTRGLNNLIWVYSSGQTAPNPAFYPGSGYVDILGVDIYNHDFQDDRAFFQQVWDHLTAIDSTKMLALAECGSVPNPDLMAKGITPKWLYALTWFGPGSGFAQNTIANDIGNWRDAYMVTEDKLPAFRELGPQPATPLVPEVGILSPLDDGSGRFVGTDPVLTAYAASRVAKIARVEFTAEGKAGRVPIGSVTSPPYTLKWTGAPAGTYIVRATAYDTLGATAVSQTVRISYNVRDLAYHAPVVSSNSQHIEIAELALLADDPDARAAGGESLTSGGKASSQNSSAGHEPEKGFDGKPDTYWQSTTPSAWLEYQFSGPGQLASQYKITSSPDGWRQDPKNWRMLGSNDGIKWQVLDQQYNQSFPGPGSSNTYDIVSYRQALYKHYRLEADNGLSEDTAPYAVDGRYWGRGAESRHVDSCWTNQMLYQKNQATSPENDDAWIYVDLGTIHEVNEVDLHWAYKISAAAYNLDVSNNAIDWTTIATQANASIIDEHPLKSFDRVLFKSTPARFVRLHATRRKENWGPYNLVELEVPEVIKEPKR